MEFASKPQWGQAFAALTFGVALIALQATPAEARRPDDHDWHRREAAAHHYWHGRPGPGVVYAPPVVYEPPPPVEESPGLSLVVPINIR